VEEGCLSVPGYRTENLTRSVTVIAKGLDAAGKPLRVKGKDDLLAQALEHEIDHINGILYVDHLESKDDLIKIEPPPGPEEEPARPSPPSRAG
jgi:peptide deformylase